MNRSPLLAIHCLTYNQEPFIRDCLEGFVMQKTNFPFVAIVHDDASTDRTADIVREYAKKYPDIIKPIFETENQYSKRDGSLGRIMAAAIEETGCKYVAMCEGDDYWINPLKLQKQVDFLEENPDYSICFHEVKVWNDFEKKMYPRSNLLDVPETTTILDLAQCNYIHTPSVVYRYNKTVEKVKADMGQLPIGDYVMHLLYAELGGIYKMSETMATYRYGVGGWSSLNSSEIHYRLALVFIPLISYFHENELICKHLKNQLLNNIHLLKHACDLNSLNYLYLQNSLSFKLGFFFLQPFRLIKSFMRKIV